MKVIQSLKHTWSLFILGRQSYFQKSDRHFSDGCIQSSSHLFTLGLISKLCGILILTLGNCRLRSTVPIPEQNSKTRTSKSGTRLSRTCMRINSSAGVSLTRRNKLSMVLSQVNTTQESTYQKNFQRIY